MLSTLKRLLPALCLTSAVFAQLPPLIDRQLLFDNPEIASAQISPDGKFIAFMKPWNATRNIWVKKTSEPFSAAHLVSAETKRPIAGYLWSRDGKFIIFVKDSGGDENFNAYAVNPNDKPAAGSEAPAARNITEAKGVRAILYAVPRSAPDVVYVGLNDRDKAWHDLYEVHISSGERKLVRKNTDRVTGWIFDNKDRLRLASRSAESGDTEILRVDEDGFKKIYSCGVFESCDPIAFDKTDQLIYLATNKGDGVDLISLATLDPASGKTAVVESDPLKRVDLQQAVISEKTHEIVATVYDDEKVRFNWKNKAWENDYQFLKGKFPGRQIGLGSRTDDERLMLVSANSDIEPGETHLFYRQTRKLTLEYKIREKIDRGALATMKPVRYKSSDGMEIPAYLTLPKGIPAKNLPAILFPHGGPWARDEWGFKCYAQFLANRGYAGLAPNFRGSTGFGKKFLNAGNQQWGEKMQDDVTWGAKWLVEQGIADPKKVAIMGGSYGGYATLAGVAFTPDQYAAAAAIVAPSNLITLLESIPPYWEPIRVMFYKRMGDPRTAEGKAQLERQSPLNSASKIKTPLIVVQGANDPRVNKREADQIVIALRDRHFPVEYLVAPDEGHGFARPVNNMAMLAAIEKFFAKHLGGRYQEDMTPEVGARLKEITVDPATVTLAKTVEATAVGLPKVAVKPAVGVCKYAAKVQMGQQTMPLTVSTEVKKVEGGWEITDTMATPMGNAVDTVLLDAETLVLVKRSVKQGPVSVQVAMAGNKATGSMNMNGQEKVIDVDMGGPLFAEGAGAPNVIGLLPLADGYTATFRNLDMQKLKTKLLQLKVEGSESVMTPAGSFETYKVHVTAADGGNDNMTYWIAKDSRKPVKMMAVMAQMGGATLTAELQQ